MKKTTAAAVSAALAVLWLAPVLMHDIQFNSVVIRPMIVAGIFAVGFIAVNLVGNIYAAAGLTAVAAAAMCAVDHEALFGAVPVLCLNAYRICARSDSGKEPPRLQRELLTDLVFAGVILQFVRLFKWGFRPVSAVAADLLFPAAFFVILVLLIVFDRRDAGSGDLAGIVPLRFNRRSLYILSAVSFVVMSLVLFDSRIIQNEIVFLQCGPHLLFFPWAMYIFALLGDEVADEVSLLPEKIAGKLSDA